MTVKFIRPILMGCIVAALLLLIFPSLRSKDWGMRFQYFFSATTPESYQDAVRRAAPAVVEIYTSGYYSAPVGSGVIMNSRGYILTNQHVIAGAKQVVVSLQNGKVFPAQLVGSDTLTDLAVLRINTSNLPVIPINADRKPQVGDIVLAIGNPYALGQTVTQGIISATGRIGLNHDIRQYFLQTDAPINQGNSGGALVNTLGELIGINTLSFNKSENGINPEGINFAIPTDMAINIMQKLISDGRVIRGYMGIEPYIDNFNTIIIHKIHPDSPAQNAGLKVGDRLLEINHKPVQSLFEIMDQVADLAPGSTVPVVIQRDNQQLTINVTIIEMPHLN